MNQRFLAPSITASLIAAYFSSPALARALPEWPYEKLVLDSDIVAILEPVENQPAKDVFPDYSYGSPANEFEATNTRFRVLVILKPAGETPKELTVLNFSYPKRATMIRDGPGFIRFLIGPLQYEKRDLKEEKPVGNITVFQEKPVWLGFLKRRPDGRFEPITGHYDSALSFRELHHASFFADP